MFSTNRHSFRFHLGNLKIGISRIIIAAISVFIISCNKNSPTDKKFAASRQDHPILDQAPYGYFLINGEKGGELGIKLRNSSAPKMTGNGKRLSVLNETLDDLEYIDIDKRQWFVPKHTLNDGASVPPILESIIPGGLNTNARYAAIVHDHFCDEMDRPGRQPSGGYPAIHKMFYQAMRCCEVEETTAALMYAAVVKFGPPSDRSLWARVAAKASPQDALKASKDSDSAFSKWIDGYRLESLDGQLRLIPKGAQLKLDAARLKAIRNQEAAAKITAQLTTAKLEMEELQTEVSSQMAMLDEGSQPSDEELQILREYQKRLEDRIEAYSKIDKAAQLANETQANSVRDLEELEKAEKEREEIMEKKAAQLQAEFEAAKDKIQKLPSQELTPDEVEKIVTSP